METPTKTKSHFIFDCETTGFIVPNYGPENPHQGRMCQVACLLLDENFREVSSYYALIQLEEHVEINKGAYEKHGISKEMCDRFGVPIQAALIQVDALSCKSTHQVAYNIAFDQGFITHEERMIFGNQNELLKFRNPICTMKLTTDICKIPYPSGKAGYKWPKQEEAYKILFNEELVDSHNALADVRACARIYKYLWDEGFYMDDETKVVPME